MALWRHHHRLPATVEGITYTGGIAGQSNASITACYSTGSVTATRNNTTSFSFASGVVGLINNGAILTACYATGNVKGEGIAVGGVVGQNEYCTVTACYHATGSVIGLAGSVGGVVGCNYEIGPYGSSIVTACYWGGTVSYNMGLGVDMSNVGEATKVEGSMTWETAMNAMNEALTNAGVDWRYATGSGAPLTLQRQN